MIAALAGHADDLLGKIIDGSGSQLVNISGL